MKNNNDETLAAIAEKSLKEVVYHLRWSGEWVIRLGDGTEESHNKVQVALNNIWLFTDDLFVNLPGDKILIENKIVPDLSLIKTQWMDHLKSVLNEATITLPEPSFMMKGGRTGNHTEHLGFILAELQFLPRAYPDAKW